MNLLKFNWIPWEMKSSSSGLGLRVIPAEHCVNAISRSSSWTQGQSSRSTCMHRYLASIRIMDVQDEQLSMTPFICTVHNVPFAAALGWAPTTPSPWTPNFNPLESRSSRLDKSRLQNNCKVVKDHELESPFSPLPLKKTVAFRQSAYEFTSVRTKRERGEPLLIWGRSPNNQNTHKKANHESP